ncbi:hypothetical protein F5144DRAFT_656848 [Chaetomium tenue]|uniref:Uncharacterized protein n=1 Tax=Chaetomium tenue TaxID=1854479 RepID=A0ACB7P1P7_9PEZI|nr:hypothetical protein F5144DRAFT_656848 [Chaetomium globosum]
MADIVQWPESNIASARTMAHVPTSLLDLPSELRNMIYDLVLLSEDPIKPWIPRPERQSHSVRLLRASQRIHIEASSVSYGRNCFDLTAARDWPHRLYYFFKKIGANNVGYIRHILVAFPRLGFPLHRPFLYPDIGAVTLKDNRAIAIIQKNCVNLSAITTSLGTTFIEHKLNDLGHDGVVVKALELVNTSFRAIPSLRDIIVKIHPDGLSDSIKAVVESCGWTLNITEPMGVWADWGMSPDKLDEDGVLWGDHFGLGPPWGYAESDDCAEYDDSTEYGYI